MRSAAPTIKQFPSKFIPSMMEAIFREYPKDADLPPPLPKEATPTGAPHAFNPFESDRLAQTRTAPQNMHQRSNEAINRRFYGNSRNRRTSRPSNDGPRIINARFPSTCHETHAPIITNDRILWFPRDKRVYCETSLVFRDFEHVQNTSAFVREGLGENS